MELMHNQTFRVLEDDAPGAYPAGIYRVIGEDKVTGKIVSAKIDHPATPIEQRGGRRRLADRKGRLKKPPPPLVGTLLWMERHELQRMHAALLLQVIAVERDSVYYKLLESPAHKALYETRVSAMAGFLDLNHLIESILENGGIGGLVREAMERAGVSRNYVYKQWSTLCRLGINEVSLRPRLDRCGAPGTHRPCDKGGRRKAGRKTKVQAVARRRGVDLPPTQPGMSTDWRVAIIAADLRIKTPVKPSMPRRYQLILDSQFVKRYKCQDGQMVPLKLTKGEYPNYQQVKRILEVDIPKLQRLRDSTTSGHFKRSLRGLVARNWKGVPGPGHTWAIDSTVADIYLRSSVNRAWIVGRPIVYVIVDVWSTAVVGFYVCLTGPSWDTARVSLFNAVADPDLVGSLWGYEPIHTLSPAPTMCYQLMCDRGEYLSKAASVTGLKLIPCMSYAPPYRPDLKGLVEVLHRIAKDAQFMFYPGTMDARRVEFDLRKSNPNECVLTVAEYVHYLHLMFGEYNLTADRSRRVDAHMAAAGVFPSPAGLWCWGHAMGVGVRRSLSQADLITSLLEADTARVGRSSVVFRGNDYQSKVAQEQEWTTHARNFGGEQIPINCYPGSVSRIWTPHASAQGLLELQISDQAKASSELTFDELADAIVFRQMQRADVDHQRTVKGLESLRRMEDIKRNASRLTREAVERDSGACPNMTEARIIELAAAPGIPGGGSEIRVTEKLRDEAEIAHDEMMQAIFRMADDAEGENA